MYTCRLSFEEAHSYFEKKCSTWYNQSCSYTPENLRYRQLIQESKSLAIESFNIAFFDDNKKTTPLFVLIAALEKSQKNLSLNGVGSRPAVSIECEHLTRVQEKQIIVKLKQILDEVDLKHFIYRDTLQDGKMSAVSKFLMEEGQNPMVSCSTIIDLKKSTALMRQQMRKSYKSLTLKPPSNTRVRVIQEENVNLTTFLKFQALHEKTTGRKTRSDETWRQQFSSIEKGRAFAVFVEDDDQLLAAGHFFVDRQSCYYGSSATIEHGSKKTPFHPAIWTALNFAKKSGCRWFELGEKMYLANAHPQSADEKKKQTISNFKSGFSADQRLFLDYKV